MLRLEEKLVVSLFGYEINLVTRGQTRDNLNFLNKTQNCFLEIISEMGAASYGAADNLEEVIAIRPHS